MTEVAGSTVDAGRDAFKRHAWPEAYELLTAADAGAELAGDDLERLAEAAVWTDDGAAVREAGTPGRGWLETAEHVVAREGMNVNRRGVVFVSAVEGRDLAALAARLAETSLAVHAALLDGDDR
ncbi:MAG TPA: hypothetical protein VHF67_03280 [Gaiellaceae bacterium]|nr:hypothetical protein [Gaiellaceae bacterium]